MKRIAFCTALVVSLFAVTMTAQAAQHHTKPHKPAHQSATHHTTTHHAKPRTSAHHGKPQSSARHSHSTSNRHASAHRGSSHNAHASARHRSTHAKGRHGNTRTAHHKTRQTRHTAHHAVRQARPVVRRAPHAPATIQDVRTAGLARWRGVARAERRYHWNDYVRPSGWYEHRWVVGENLPAAWFAEDYRIADWSGFGLMGPPIGFVWARVGDDAVLVDVETGEVLRVVYGVFY